MRSGDSICRIPEIQTLLSRIQHGSLSGFLGLGKTFFREHLTAHRASGPNNMMGGLRSGLLQGGCLEFEVSMRVMLAVMDRVSDVEGGHPCRKRWVSWSWKVAFPRRMMGILVVEDGLPSTNDSLPSTNGSLPSTNDGCP